MVCFRRHNTMMATSKSGPKVVPPRFTPPAPRPSRCVVVPPRIVKTEESKVDQMTMYGTSLPAAVTKAEVMLHCLVWCGVKPVADLITTMRPSMGQRVFFVRRWFRFASGVQSSDRQIGSVAFRKSQRPEAVQVEVGTHPVAASSRSGIPQTAMAR